jgi:hypothetical protein
VFPVLSGKKWPVKLMELNGFYVKNQQPKVAFLVARVTNFRFKYVKQHSG